MTVTNLNQIEYGKTKNVDMSAKIQEHMCAKKIFLTWNPATCNCENDRYGKSIIDDSVIIEATKSIMTNSFAKSVPINLIKERSHVKQTISIFYLAFY